MGARRSFISGALASGLAAAGLKAHAAASGDASGTASPLVILVHGSRHSSFCWARVTPYLVAKGCRVLAIDLPGTGLGGRFPTSTFARPFDAAAYAVEQSPSAAITLSDYANALGNLVDDLHAAKQGPIVLVGHSLGGLTLNAVGESRSEKLAGLIYLAAVLPSNNESLIDAMSSKPSFGTSFNAQGKNGVIPGSAAKTGAGRLDLNTTDPALLATMKAAYCADTSDETFRAWLNMLVPDDAAAPQREKIRISTARWGSLKRSYIKCLQDNIVPPALADELIAAVDLFAPAKKTIVRSLDASHSSFLSKPKELAAVIAELAA